MRINHLHNNFFLHLAPSGPPINLRGHPTNPSAMIISWSKPRLLDQNGQITNYIITLRNKSDEESFVIAANRCDSSKTARSIYPGDCLSGRHSVTISNLAPYIIYDVRIAAMNVNGTGPMSDPVKLSSGEDSELSMHGDVIICTAYTYVVVVVCGHGSICYIFVLFLLQSLDHHRTYE